MDAANLMKPREFQRRHRDWFRTESALLYHLRKRDENGMVASGLVLETPIGLRIDPEKFPDWLRYRPASQVSAS